MSFTDEDLKLVKRDLDGFRSWASNEQVLALLARLEAAEEALNGSTHIEVDYPERECEGCENMKAWRKSKGL